MAEVLSINRTQELNVVLQTTPLLRKFGEEFDIIIHRFGGAEFFPNKQYGGRVVVPFEYSGETGGMLVLAMNAGDGTGDTSTYREGDLIIPEAYQFDTRQERVFPRKKIIPTPEGEKPLPVEVAVPLATIDPSGKILQPYNTDLVWLGVRDNTIVKMGNVSRHDRDPMPKILFTVEGVGENRIGDPHAIFAPKETEGRIQIVAFISATNIQSRIGKLLDHEASRMSH